MLQPRLEFAQRVDVAVRNDLDAAIGKIARMTAKSETLGFRTRRGAKEHALHPAADDEFRANHDATASSRISPHDRAEVIVRND